MNGVYYAKGYGKNINDNVLFSIMADKATESGNNEHLVCMRWVGNNFDTHEDIIGIHAVENKVRYTCYCYKDILRLNMPLPNCYGKCYHRASNMTEIKQAVGTQIK